jgi:hypothetical protein
VGDSLAGGTIDSITETTIRIGGDAPRTLDLVNRAGDTVTKGHAPTRGTSLQPAKPGSLAMVKQPSPQGISLGAANGGGINGQEIPPVPEYIRPEQAKRFEELRSEIRSQKSFGSEGEIAEYAAKLLSSEDPKSVDVPLMEKMGRVKSFEAKGVKN